MALQQFVNQVKSQSSKVEPQQDQPNVQKILSAPEQTFQDNSQLVAEAAKVSAKQAATNTLNSKPPALGDEDCETLSALAAVQIKYGRPSEAIPYLMMLRRNNPADTEVARLLALALMKMGHWQQAEIIMDDLHGGPATANSSALMLFRSIVAFKQRKLEAARSWLQRFREYVAGSAA